MNYSNIPSPIVQQAIANGQIPTSDIYVCHETTRGGYVRVVTRVAGQRSGLRTNSKGQTIDHSTWYMYILTPEGMNVSGAGQCSNSIKGYSPYDAPRGNRLGFIFTQQMADTLVKEFGAAYNYRGYVSNFEGTPGISAPNTDVIFNMPLYSETRKALRCTFVVAA